MTTTRSRPLALTLPACAVLATGLLSSACDGPGETTPPKPKNALALDFEPIEHDLAFSYITDMEFVRSPSPDFIVTDLTGGFAHMRLQDGKAVTLSTAAVEVYVELDAGLLGVAVDPDFETNHFVYLALNDTKTKTAIRRFTIDDEDPEKTLASVVTILEMDTPGSPRWHNITSLGFEEGGVMWATVGDKGMFEPAQDPTDLLGSLIRIIPSREEGKGGYTTPPDAPLYAAGADPAIFAKGLRSPWKGFHHQGKYYIGDVGLDSIEEVNVIDAPGQNLGWHLLEGPCELDVLGTAPPDCEARMRDPYLYYDRSNSHPYVAEDADAAATNKRSVYAGWVYEPNDLDPYDGRWDDVLVFGDTYVGFMRAKPLGSEVPDYHVAHLRWASAWAQAPDGFVYISALADSPSEDETPPAPIYRAVLAK